MAYIAMTGNAGTFFLRFSAMNLADECAVALYTVGLDHIRVEAPDADGVRIVACGEGQAVIPAVNAFYNILLWK